MQRVASDTALDSKLEPTESGGTRGAPLISGQTRPGENAHFWALRMGAIELLGLSILIWLPLLVVSLAAGVGVVLLVVLLLVLEFMIVHTHRAEICVDRLELRNRLYRRTIAFSDVESETCTIGLLLCSVEFRLADGRNLEISSPTWIRPQRNLDALVAAIRAYRLGAVPPGTSPI